jgi:hypothetical protein
MAVQPVLRPYATAGIALVGASIIAVTPLAVPLPEVQMRPVKLVDAWSDLLTDTTANLQNIVGNADPTAISGVFSALLSNPLGVIQAFTDLTPTVTGSLPSGINVELPPGLEVLIAQIGAEGATFNAISDVVGELSSNPSAALSTLLEAPATILNGFLNGEDNISLLNGIIDITGFNGILAPLQDVSIDLNLPDLLNALGVGNLSLSGLGVDLGSLLDQIGLGNLDLGGLFSALGLSGDGLGTLLGNPTLGGLLGDLGLGEFDLSGLNLTDILTGLGLNTDLNDLSLNTVLNAFGIDPTIATPLTGLLDAFGFETVLDTGLGTELSNLNLLQPLLTGINDVLSGVLGPLSGALNPILMGLGLNTGDLLSLTGLEDALNADTVGSLLGGQSIDATVSTLLGDLGVSVPTDGLTIGGILTDLGAAGTTGDLTLGGLLTDLGVGTDGVSGLLNTVNLGDLLGDLGLSDTALNLSNLGDISGLTVDGLLGDLGLGDVGVISIDGIGGLETLLADVIPQQILASLGM